MLKVLLELGRVSNLPTVLTNCLAAWVLAGAASGAVPAFWWTVLGACLVYVGGTTLNDAFDAGHDAERRSSRPIPSGRISAKAVWSLGGVALAAGFVVLVVAGGVDPFFGVILVLAVLFYDFVHKRSAVGVWIMGLCRALLYLAAATSAVAEPRLEAVAWLAAATGFYVVGLSLVARGEAAVTADISGGGAVAAGAGTAGKGEHERGPGASTGAARPKPSPLVGLPVLLMFAPLVYAALNLRDYVALNPEGGYGPIAFVLLLTLWVVAAVWLFQKRGPAGTGRFVERALAGIILIDATVVALVDLRAAIFCLVLFGLTLVFQRLVPAT